MTSQPAAAQAVTTEDFSRNLATVNQKIAEAASRSGRQASAVRLLPVTKTIEPERLRLAIEAGVQTLGRTRFKKR